MGVRKLVVFADYERHWHYNILTVKTFYLTQSMAARLFLAIVGLAALMWYLSWYRTADKSQRNRSLVSILLYGVAAALLILVLTGRIPWLFALFSAATPWINRAMRVKMFWNMFNQARAGQPGGKPNSAAPSAKMTLEEAYKILDLEPGASEDEIVDAHP